MSFSGLKHQLESDEFKILLREQRKWKNQRNKICEDKKRVGLCLVRVYENRLNTLEIFSKKILPPLTELDSICSGKAKRNDVNEEFFDINNDGKNEIGKKCWGGTMGNPCMEFQDENGKEIRLKTIGFEWKKYWTHYSNYFEYKDKTYKSHSNDVGPSHITYTTPENHSYVVCEFENIKSEKIFPVEKSLVNADICSLASKNKLQYISLKDKSQITYEQMKNLGRYEAHVTKQGYLDINNDGNIELIAEVNYASGANRGCDFRYYDELNVENGIFTNTKGKTPLLKMQRVNLDNRHPNCGGTNNKLFKHGGKVYYEINTSKEHRISILEGNQVRNICDVKRSVQTNVNYIGPPNK
jgi:hypothetical protein